MNNGGWMLFGIVANKPVVSPVEFFRGQTGGGLQTTIENYGSKRTWSGDILDFIPEDSGFEMPVN